ncbi:hypothetical protein Clacol_003861 [Clathrus columnatus]|uniref:YDG domain-containing protein n=1 Tax=Clathrus columnatus TaxID=1419009 RepID=A0AAV5A7K0_9AGAM|nr:hypothetical protein Clacol_003861 [Clathrus columnatus]
MDFGAIRQQNIDANIKLLKSLGFENPVIPRTSKKNASPRPKKRKPNNTQKGDAERPRKIAKIASEQKQHPVDDSGRRRSQRIAAAKPKPDLQIYSDGEDRSESEYENETQTRRTKTRLKVVVKSSNTEAECSTDAIHAPFVAGIAGSAQDGAYSVALSGGYEDDVDLGYAFTYTGSGGRNLKGTKDKPKNRSVETRRPVRVVRGYKLDSEFAPAHGYRYDGLYTVEKAWLERGLNAHGYKVCKFAFKRLPGQPPLPRKEDGDGTSENEEQDGNSEDEPTDAKKVADNTSTEEPNEEREQTSDEAD